MWGSIMACGSSTATFGLLSAGQRRRGAVVAELWRAAVELPHLVC